MENYEVIQGKYNYYVLYSTLYSTVYWKITSLNRENIFTSSYTLENSIMENYEVKQGKYIHLILYSLVQYNGKLRSKTGKI